MAMTPGLYIDISEEQYHADRLDDSTPSLSVSIAQALVLESAAHAYLRHPRLGGQPVVPSTIMDRGTLIHALLLGKGRELAIVECEDWKKPANRKLRDEHRAAGRLAVTRSLYDDSIEAAKALEAKLRKRGFVFNGSSEVTLVWDETADDGSKVRCRARTDHIVGERIYDLKIGDANPKRIKRGHLTSMGYDIQGAAYPRALEYALPQLVGRASFTLLFCEPEPPYCVTPVRFGGSLRELGTRKWLRGVNVWEQCLRLNEWPDYIPDDEIMYAEARPFELEDEEGAAA
jgi:hypothetical protein